MFNYKDINRYIFYLTGQRNFFKVRKTPKRIFPESYVRKRKLFTLLNKDIISTTIKNEITFHEFCHFVEADDLDLLNINFNLQENSYSRLRESRVRCIQYTLAPKIGSFCNKVRFNDDRGFSSFYENKFNIHSCIDPIKDNMSIWRDVHNKNIGEESMYRNFDYIAEKITHNVKLVKMFT